MNLRTVARYWHTVRYLRPVQITGRLRFRFLRPSLPLTDLPTVREQRGVWVEPVTRARTMLGPTQFRFLNVDGVVGNAADWNSAAHEKLWLYNLHYFDDLVAAGAVERAEWHAALIVRWIAENPPTTGNGWEPYPSSLRIVNWIRWAMRGRELPAGFADSLALQARWLFRRVEHHIQGNHLFVNAKALVMAGCWFQGAEADAWRAAGLRILQEEVRRQLLADGAHYERSPMYHALILDDLLDLVNMAAAIPGLADDATVNAWRIAAARMLGWLAALTHPDGEPAFFNDATSGIAPTLADLRAYATRLGLVSGPLHTELQASGYHRAERGEMVLLLDAAPVGPDEQPGHAHADTLSFELSRGSQRVIVNGGTSTYAMGTQRSRERSTAMHSTVTIGDEDSSEVWGGFRVARRARVLDVRVALAPDHESISASHDGYARLPGRPVHRRQWTLSADRLEVLDEITGSPVAPVVARYHLHPDVVAGTDGQLVLPDGTTGRWVVRGGAARVVESEWAPAFGVRRASRCIEVTFQSVQTQFVLEWYACGS